MGDLELVNRVRNYLFIPQVTTVEPNDPINSLIDSVKQDYINIIASSYPWVTLSSLVTGALVATSNKEFGYAYIIEIPADFISLLAVYRSETNDILDFSQDSSVIYVNEENVDLLYIYRISLDTDPFPTLPNPFIYDLLAIKIAAEMGLSITRSEKIQQGLLELYELRFKEAKAYDSRVTPPKRRQPFGQQNIRFI